MKDKDKIMSGVRSLRRWEWMSYGKEVEHFVTGEEKGGRVGCR